MPDVFNLILIAIGILFIIFNTRMILKEFSRSPVKKGDLIYFHKPAGRTLYFIDGRFKAEALIFQDEFYNDLSGTALVLENKLYQFKSKKKKSIFLKKCENIYAVKVFVVSSQNNYFNKYGKTTLLGVKFVQNKTSNRKRKDL